MTAENGNRGTGRLADRLQACLAPMYGLMMAGIAAVCVLFSGITFGKSEYCANYLPPLLLMVFGVVFLFGLFSFCEQLSERQKGGRRLLPLISLCLFFLQLYSVYNYYFFTDWDIPNLIRVSDAIVHGTDIAAVPGIRYFSRYPNNLFLAYIVTVIRKAAHMLGLHDQEYFAILCVQCALNTLTGLLLVRVLNRLLGQRRLSVLGYCVYMLLVGASPWVSIPYSDSMGLIFPILLICIYIDRKKARHPLFPWFWMAGLAYIGYKIKPQIFIVFLAILLMEVLGVLKAGLSRDLLKRLASIVLGLVCAGLFAQAAISSLNVPIYDEMTFQLPHFLMMGMNPEDMGVWSKADVKYSGSFATLEERNAANLNMALERVRKMGPAGLFKHLIRKTLTNYCDGTFCWSGEGYFFREVFEERGTPLCGLLRGLYYTREYAETGKYYTVWSNFEQMLWLTVLLLNVFAGTVRRHEERDVIMLAIIGLTLFEMIFEARARYLFTYAPLYIVLAAAGFQWITERLRKQTL